jgi:hypothetical protein
MGIQVKGLSGYTGMHTPIWWISARESVYFLDRDRPKMDHLRSRCDSKLAGFARSAIPAAGQCDGGVRLRNVAGAIIIVGNMAAF